VGSSLIEIGVDVIFVVAVGVEDFEIGVALVVGSTRTGFLVSISPVYFFFLKIGIFNSKAI
jgi:hypothetical protein